MTFADLAANDHLFLDANTLVYHFASHQVFGPAAKQLGVTAHPLFSLKGWNKSAQGNALGPTRPKDASPERAKQGREPHDVAPIQG